jgi:hypothetical protein
MELPVEDVVATTLAKTEIEIEEGMTSIATDGEINIVTRIEEIDGTILIASQNGKNEITILIVNMILTTIGNDGEIGMVGRGVRMGVIKGVDGLLRREAGVRGKIDDKRVYILEGMGFANAVAVNIKNT